MIDRVKKLGTILAITYIVTIILCLTPTFATFINDLKMFGLVLLIVVIVGIQYYIIKFIEKNIRVDLGKPVNDFLTHKQYWVFRWTESIACFLLLLLIIPFGALDGTWRDRALLALELYLVVSSILLYMKYRYAKVNKVNGIEG